LCLGHFSNIFPLYSYISQFNSPTIRPKWGNLFFSSKNKDVHKSLFVSRSLNLQQIQGHEAILAW
jgi:hypothetical protein